MPSTWYAKDQERMETMPYVAGWPWKESSRKTADLHVSVQSKRERILKPRERASLEGGSRAMLAAARAAMRQAAMPAVVS